MTQYYNFDEWLLAIWNLILFKVKKVSKVIKIVDMYVKKKTKNKRKDI